MTKPIGKQQYLYCLSLLQLGSSTNHNRILSCGFIVGLFYGASWVSSLLERLLEGSSSPALNLGFLYLGLAQLWRDRHSLKALKSYEEERFVGELMILGGAGAFAACQSSLSMQAFIWAMILSSMAWSHWGIGFFQRFWLPFLLIVTSQYPNYSFLSAQIWQIVMPPNLLESFMAWSGSLVFQAFGQPAISQEVILSLAVPLDLAKSVKVGFGCNGFDMAFTLATASLILGLFVHLNWWKTVRLMAASFMLALLFNIPRIVLLALAAVYWGKDWFDFWHGPWGGQIFSGILSTVYYYRIRGLLTLPSQPSKANSA